MVRSLDGDTNFFDIITRLARRYTNMISIYNLPRLLFTNTNRSNKNGLKKASSRRYPAETLTNADNTDYLAFLRNKSTLAGCQLHSLGQATRYFGLYMNSDKTEFIWFKQNGANSTLSDKLLKTINHFTYLGSNISSTKSDDKILIRKAWTTINRLSTIWKSNLW